MQLCHGGSRAIPSLTGVEPRSASRFELPATRVEAMYAPEIFGETPNAGWVVEDEVPAR